MESRFSSNASPDPLASIDWGTQVDTSIVRVQFVPRGSVFGEAIFEWSAYEKRQAMLALEQVANVTNLEFRRAGSEQGTDFFLVLSDLEGGVLGQMSPPGEDWAGLAVFDPFEWGWDYRSPGYGGLEQGGYGFVTMIHEFGHGLGLAHPHDNGGGSTVWEGVDAPFGSFGRGLLNQGVFTTMSYNDGWATGPLGVQFEDLSFGYQGTMMALDVALLQEKYGANLDHATGDDVYRLPEVNATGAFYACIWDAGGTDRIENAGDAPCYIDLRDASLRGEYGGAGWISFVLGVHGGFTIANGVMIEAAYGGSAGDGLRGNAGANTLIGRAGDDFLVGARGGDMIRGGDGADLLGGGLGQDLLSGGEGPDNLRGGGGDDLLEGGSGPDVFVLDQGQGDDVIADFEDGIDLIRFRSGADGFGDLDLSEREGDTTVALADASVTLTGVSLAALDPGDFIFG